MSVLERLTSWWAGEPSIVERQMTDVHQSMRQAVHESRNLAQMAQTEARLAEKASDRICQVAQQVIERLEAVRQESHKCED